MRQRFLYGYTILGLMLSIGLFGRSYWLSWEAEDISVASVAQTIAATPQPFQNGCPEGINFTVDDRYFEGWSESDRLNYFRDWIFATVLSTQTDGEGTIQDRLQSLLGQRTWEQRIHQWGARSHRFSSSNLGFDTALVVQPLDLPPDQQTELLHEVTRLYTTRPSDRLRIQIFGYTLDADNQYAAVVPGESILLRAADIPAPEPSPRPESNNPPFEFDFEIPEFEIPELPDEFRLNQQPQSAGDMARSLVLGQAAIASPDPVYMAKRGTSPGSRPNVPNNYNQPGSTRTNPGSSAPSQRETTPTHDVTPLLQQTNGQLVIEEANEAIAADPTNTLPSVTIEATNYGFDVALSSEAVLEQQLSQEVDNSPDTVDPDLHRSLHRQNYEQAIPTLAAQPDQVQVYLQQDMQRVLQRVEAGNVNGAAHLIDTLVEIYGSQPRLEVLRGLVAIHRSRLQTQAINEPDLDVSESNRKFLDQVSALIAADDGTFDFRAIALDDALLYVQDSPELNNIDWSPQIEASLPLISTQNVYRLDPGPVSNARLSGVEAGIVASENEPTADGTAEEPTTDPGDRPSDEAPTEESPESSGGGPDGSGDDDSEAAQCAVEEPPRPIYVVLVAQ
ncbi:MAG: hypothetical protein AAFY26_01370 [Cyanobacteria bacterium J06638_22]